MQECISKTISVHEAPEHSSERTPKIEFQGKYLKDLGYDIGQKIKLIISEKQIVIEPITE